jgi:hypothetical protein
VRLDAQIDTLWAGVNIKFGRSSAKPSAMASSAGDGSVVATSRSSDPIEPAPPTSSGADIPAPPVASDPPN